MLQRKKTSSRSDILEAAGRAQAKGRRKRAITEYQKLLKENGEDYIVHGKVAPLLAECRRHEEAWASFRASGEGYLKDGFEDKAKSVYIQATRFLPYEINGWKRVVKLHIDRGHRADALKTLREGRRRFSRRSHRKEAIVLLRIAWKLTPWHFDVTFDLARLLAKSGDHDNAMRFLLGLAERENGYNLRRVRGAILKMAPGPHTAWLWLRASLMST